MFILKKILHVVNLCLVLGLLLTYLPSLVDFDSFPKLTLLSYAYPFLFLANLVFVLLWLVLGPRTRALWSAVAIAIRFSFVLGLVNFSKQEVKHNKDIGILSYNVETFLHNNLYDENKDSVISYIHRSKPDIVCLQDCHDWVNDKGGFHHRMTKVLNYRYCYYFKQSQDSKHIADCVIFSKYHILQAGTILPDNERNYSLIYADILIDSKTIRVYNFHLLSYRLDQSDRSSYSELIHGHTQKSKEGKLILKKLVDADLAKKKQSEEILPLLDSVPYPYVIAGDFNSTPFSYIYRRYTAKLSDSFVHKGRGIGRTYNGVFPAYRIDYILFEKQYFRPKSYSSPALDFSDHYPVTVTFELKDF